MGFFSFPHTEAKLKKIEAAKKLSSTGGEHRAQNLSAMERSAIASHAAKARWNNLQAS